MKKLISSRIARFSRPGNNRRHKRFSTHRGFVKALRRRIGGGLA
jgi:hypothetical protein